MQSGILQKFYTWILTFAQPVEKPIEAPEPVDEPLLKLPRMMVAIGSRQGSRDSGSGIQLLVDALNQELITCKSKHLFKEGDQLQLALLMQGIGHVQLPVTVEWVLLSNFGHSLGLRIQHSDESRELMKTFVNLLKNDSRG